MVTGNISQWLHRSAAAFGDITIGSESMDCQSPQNMVFGTHQANSLMMRYVSVPSVLPTHPSLRLLLKIRKKRRQRGQGLRLLEPKSEDRETHNGPSP